MLVDNRVKKNANIVSGQRASASRCEQWSTPYLMQTLTKKCKMMHHMVAGWADAVVAGQC